MQTIQQAVNNLIQPRAPRLNAFFNALKPITLDEVFKNTDAVRDYVTRRDGNSDKLGAQLKDNYYLITHAEISLFMQSNYQHKTDADYKKLAVRAFQRTYQERDHSLYKYLISAYKKEGHRASRAKSALDKPLHRPLDQEETNLTDDERYAYRASNYLRAVLELSGRGTEKIEPATYEIVKRWQDNNWEPITDFNLNIDAKIKNGLSFLHSLHQLHQSITDPLLIAYYPTLRHYREGREVKTKLGKYLTAFKNILGISDEGIRDLVNQWNGQILGKNTWQLKFATTKREWREVYRTDRVHSCMRGEDCVSIYAHDKSTVRLAYIQDENNEILARCIVRDEPANKKGWIRFYPPTDQSMESKTLSLKLDALGYTQQTDLNGCLLDAVPHDDYPEIFAMPYIDTANGTSSRAQLVEIDGRRYFEIGRNDADAQDYYIQNTNGWTDDLPDVYRYCCEDCDDGMTENDGASVGRYSDRLVCDCCLDNYTRVIGRRGEQYYLHQDDEIVYCESDGEYYDANYLTDNGIHLCQIYGDYYHIDDLVYTSRGYIHIDEAEHLDHPDENGNDYAYKADTATLSDGTTCHIDDEDRLQAELDEQTNQEEMTA